MDKLFVQSQCIVEENVSNDDSFVEQPLNNPRQMVNNSQNEFLICSHCKTEQPISEFYKTTNYSHEKRGRSYTCKTCCRESARKAIMKRKMLKKVNDETVLSG